MNGWLTSKTPNGTEITLNLDHVVWLEDGGERTIVQMDSVVEIPGSLPSREAHFVVIDEPLASVLVRVAEIEGGVP